MEQNIYDMGEDDEDDGFSHHPKQHNHKTIYRSKHPYFTPPTASTLNHTNRPVCLLNVHGSHYHPKSALYTHNRGRMWGPNKLGKDYNYSKAKRIQENLRSVAIPFDGKKGAIHQHFVEPARFKEEKDFKAINKQKVVQLYKPVKQPAPRYVDKEGYGEVPICVTNKRTEQQRIWQKYRMKKPPPFDEKLAIEELQYFEKKLKKQWEELQRQYSVFSTKIPDTLKSKRHKQSLEKQMDQIEGKLQKIKKLKNKI